VSEGLQGANHELKKELRLRDLVPMQILLVVGVTWCGIAAKQGGTQLWFWLLGIVFFFLPLARLVTYCVQVWPQEGGVYQWTKHAIGPWAGFLSAWNFAFWVLLVVSNLGILTATSLSYSLGENYRWMATNNWFILALSVVLFGIILLVNLPGFHIGKWVSHFGTAVMLLVTFLLMILLVWHPHQTATHQQVIAQSRFSLATNWHDAFKGGGAALHAHGLGLKLQLVSELGVLFTINLFTKVAFNALSGLEQVAVFAGETRNAAKTILRSAWVAAPVIAIMYILMTGSILTYIPASKVDLTGPIPQILAAAFSGGSATAATDWGLVLGRGAILALALACIAQYAVVVAEISRLPMVAGWDGLLPSVFTRLHPKWKTPVWSIATMVGLAFVAAVAAIYLGKSNQVAFQLIVTVANLCGGVYYVLFFLVPLVVGDRFGQRPSLGVKLCGLSCLIITLMAMALMMQPIVEVKSRGMFAVEVLAAGILANVMGLGVYWYGSRRRRAR
jgi:amino acid transporter